MNLNEYISSGVLELYIAGSLSESENKAVYEMLLKHPEVLNEVFKIEKTIVKLTASASPFESKYLLNSIKQKLNLNNETPIVTLTNNNSNWLRYSGWAASFVLAGGLLYFMNQANEITNKYDTLLTQQEILEQQIFISNTDLAEVNKLNSILRDKDIITIALQGQANFSETYAKVYWQKEAALVYVDAQGLPEPPKGKVYQVWSLKLNPLTPTSLGLLVDFATDDNKVFALESKYDSDAFGITLEPEGGSEAPTMEQLHTLGVTNP